ncbi:hypothetical protein AB3Y40_16190 [Yoonia sp. R2331]|uniref:hypothetical protein n=1 Tax=Yoonia sp. R2331 TaxID=3237238 RepID=UPI0034E5435B
MLTLLVFVAAIFWANSLKAQDLFSLPAGCDAFVTIQNADCSVDHNFICAGDPEGHKQRVSLDEQGMTYLGTTDDQTQWINSFHPLTGHTERLEDNPVDRANLDELIQTGQDTYDFKTLSDEFGVTRYVGQDALTGREITIDDVTLAETEYNITAYAEDGTEIWRSSGNEFISRNWRMFLSGVGTIVTASDSFERDGRPVEFIYPGEPGFLSANPKHGCGVVMSSFEVLE